MPAYKGYKTKRLLFRTMNVAEDGHRMQHTIRVVDAKNVRHKGRNLKNGDHEMTVTFTIPREQVEKERRARVRLAKRNTPTVAQENIE